MKECEESVIEKIRSRRDAGRKKYGQTMERTDLNHLQWLVHAQEEAMDFAIYLERLIREECKRNPGFADVRTSSDTGPQNV